MYYVSVSPLPHAVLDYVRQHQLLKAGDRAGAAVSGGADSVVLLRLLLELREEIGIVLSVVHFNHRLRGADADADESFVADLARRHKLPMHCESGDVAAYAATKRLSVEAAAREVRYAYFRRLLQQGVLNRIATAHTLDDQAETVLLRMVRGAASRGLAGIYPRLSVAGSQFPDAAIVRPILAIRRRDLESYLRELGQDWREDKSNRDLRHARNRVRHGILPRLERNLNPSVREALAETAEIARAEEEYWQAEVVRALPGVLEEQGVLNLARLVRLPLALQRRVIRAASEALGLRLEFRHVEEVLALCASDRGSGRAPLPHGWAAVRSRTELRFAPATADQKHDYEYRFPVPGSVEVPELRARFEVVPIAAGASPENNCEHRLDRAALEGELTIRNWRAGDHFWPPHTRAPRKIKELLPVTGAKRKFWPVIVSGTEVVWVRGLGVPLHLQPGHGAQAVAIREVPLQLSGC